MGDVSSVDDSEAPENCNDVNETASLNDEETNLHWDIGFGDFVLHNDISTDRNVSKFLQRTKPEIINFMKSVLLRKRKVKYNIILQVRCSKDVLQQSPLRSPYISLENPSDIEDTFDVLAALIELKLENFSDVHEILRIEINIRKGVCQCGSFLELPPEISSLEAVINFPNNNNYCFKYAILVGAKHLSKAKTEPLEELDVSKELISYGGLSLNFSGLTYPLRTIDVRIFEEHNPRISVSVFEVLKKSRTMYYVQPIYQTRHQKNTHFNLLYLENPKKTITHYAYISNLDKLIRGAPKRRLSSRSVEVVPTTESTTLPQ